MTAARDTGGPAFPEQIAVTPVGDTYSGAEGMTLRDYFAVRCPITFEEARDYNTSGEDMMAFYCTMCFEYADAMLIERAK